MTGRTGGMAEPGGDGGKDPDAALPRIGPVEAGGSPEPDWVPAPPEAWPPIEDRRPPEPPRNAIEALAVGEVYVVGPDGVPAPTASVTGTAAEPGRAQGARPAWLLVLGSLVAAAVTAAVLVAVVGEDAERTGFAWPDGRLADAQDGPEAAPHQRWSVEAACGAYDGLARDDQYSTRPGCELGADDEHAYLLRRAEGEDATLTAFDGDSGAEVWQVGMEQGADAVLVVPGLVLVARAGYGRDRVTAYDRASGALRWSAAGGGGLPLGVDRTLVLTRGRLGRQIAGVSLDDGDDRWTVDLELVGLCRDTVYGVDADELVALDPASGSERWRAEVAEGASVQCAGDQVVALHEGEVRSFDREDGAQRWAVDLGATSISVLEEVSLVRVGDTLVALEAEDGSRRWTVPGAPFEGIYSFDGLSIDVAVGLDGAWVHVLELADGRLLGRRRQGQQLQIGVPQGLVFTLDRGELEAFSVVDLSVAWQAEIDPTTRRLTLGGGHLYALGPEALVAYG